MPNEGRAEPLGEALKRYLDRHGLKTRVEQAEVLTAWPELVGPAVAAATEPLSISADGTLMVAVRTSAWMSELSMMERELLAAINRATPRSPIARIHWRLHR